MPFDPQRRLLTGFHIPICILAAIGLHRWFIGGPQKLTKLISFLVVIFGISGTLFAWECAP